MKLKAELENEARILTLKVALIQARRKGLELTLQSAIDVCERANKELNRGSSEQS